MSNKPKESAQPNFERAMDRLELIVEEMESGKLPLDDLIQRYDEGMKLVKVCQEQLANAEQKIEIILRESSGKTTVKDFAPEAKNQSSANQVNESTDEVRLF